MSERQEPVFWSVIEAERLSMETPEEAIVEAFEAMDEDERPRAMTVRGYAPTKIDGAGYADGAVERFREALQEEYGDPDGDDLDIIPKEVEAVLLAEIGAAFEKAAAASRAWSCEVVETREYTAEQVEAIVREECPEYFEEEAVTSGCTCRTGDGPGLHDDGCYMTLPKDQRDGTI